MNSCNEIDSNSDVSMEGYTYAESFNEMPHSNSSRRSFRDLRTSEKNEVSIKRVFNKKNR